MASVTTVRPIQSGKGRKVHTLSPVEAFIIAACKRRFDNPREYTRKDGSTGTSQVIPSQEIGSYLAKFDPKYDDNTVVGTYTTKKGAVKQLRKGQQLRQELYQSMADRGLIKLSWAFGPALADVRYEGSGRRSGEFDDLIG